MQITDQQFIDAMHKVVDLCGPKHTSVGRYRDRSGAPACVIGMALGQISMSLVPFDNKYLAHHLLLRHGASHRVADAAKWAQNANDYSCYWEDVLHIFDTALHLHGHAEYHERLLKMLGDARARAVAGGNKTAALIAQNIAATETLNAVIQKQATALAKANAALASGGWLAPSDVIATGANVTINPGLTAIGIDPPHIKSAFAQTA